MLPIIKSAKERDYDRIIELQEKNLLTNLSTKKDGFLTVEFSIEMLAEIDIVVAEVEGVLAGYFMAQSLDFNKRFPLLNEIISRFSSTSFKGKSIECLNPFIVGPMCVSEEFRGRGLPKLMFDYLVSSQTGLAVTFASIENHRSLYVLEKRLGMSLVDRINFNENDYAVLAKMAGES